MLASATPASATPAASPELEDVPAVLDAELSATEKQSLAALTDGTGVQLEAFVLTPEGAEIVTLDADSRADAEAATDVLEAQPSVQSASLTVRVSATAGALPQYGNTMIRSAEAVAEVDNPLSDVVVAVLDTGVSPHAELAAALVPGQNFSDSPGGAADTTDRHGHGTHVAGTIGADAGSQVEGVAPGVRIMPVKVLGDGGSGFSDWANSGIIWATDNGADVINMSLGGSDGPGVYASAVAYARARGVTVIAAAGNDNSSAPHYPSGEAGVISVAAVDTTQQKAYFSNYGPTVDVAAPGVAITSTDVSGGYSDKSGTSMASPHVAGIAALVKAAAPGFTPDQVEQAIIAGVADLGTPGRDDIYGYGLVSALHSVRAANAMEASLPPSTNRAPVADDEALTIPYDSGSHRIDVLAGDTDPDGDLLGIASFTQGSRGAVTTDNGQLRYTPSGFGPFTDAFTYVLTDYHGGTATGTVRIDAVAPDPSNRAPVAGDDQFTFATGQNRAPLFTAENDTDPDGDRLKVVWVSQPSLGATEIISGVAYYTPPLSGSGSTSFEYRVSDFRGGSDTAVVSVTVRPTNGAPVAAPDRLVVPHDAAYAELNAGANDTDPDGDVLYVTSVGTPSAGTANQLMGNGVRYTPSGDFPGGTTDTFTYTVHDSFGGWTTGRVDVVVDPTPAAGTPGAPSLPSATSGDGSVLLRWSAPAVGGSSAISGYRVRAFDNGSLVSTTTVGTTTSTTITGLRNGKAHTFAVAAVNAAGTGPDSARVAAVPGASLPGPPGITATSAGNRSVWISWTAPTSDGGNPITGYAVRAFQNGSLVRTTEAGRTDRSTAVPGLSNGVPYTFAVVAVNDVGTGAESARSAPVTPRTVPVTPELQGVSPRDGAVTVRWSASINDNGSPITGYTVHAYRGTTAVGTTPTPAGATSVIVPGLTNGTAYTFAVTATNAAGPSAESARSATVTPRAVTPAAALDLAVVHRLGADSMNLWRMPVSQLDSGYGRPALVKTLDYGGFSYDRSRTLAGNVGNVTGTDDGTPDQVIWHAQPNGGVLLWAVGGGSDTTPRLWLDLRTGGWSWADSVPMLGDVNGDGFDDLVVRHAYGPAVTNIWVFLSNGQRLGAPQLWGTTQGLARRSLLVDADADGREDLLVARPSDGIAGLSYDILGANTSGTAFDGFDRTVFGGSATAGWSEGSSRTLAADVTGDGKTDLITVHAQSGNSGLLVWVHENCTYVLRAPCFRLPVIWQDLRTGGWSYTGSRQYVADTDGDGTEDLISAHSQAGNPGILVWRHRSTSTSLLPPEIIADLRAGGWSYTGSRATVG